MSQIKKIWEAHREVRRGRVSAVLGAETSAEVAKTAALLSTEKESGRRGDVDELRPTSSPARSELQLSSVPS